MRKPRGRHPHQRLTVVRVNSIKTPGRYADGNGLYMVVDDSGAKRWILRTIVAVKHSGHGADSVQLISSPKRCDVGLGSVQLVSLAKARTEAARLRALARDGHDILAARRTERRVVPTFEAAAREVNTHHTASFRNRQHREIWLSSLQADVFPVFGSRAVNVIDTGDVLQALTPIWNTKPETARRVKQRIKMVLDWAKAKGFRNGDNPVTGIEKVLPRHRQAAVHHSALAYAQVPAFVHAIRDAKAGESAKLGFEFSLLTASRTNEVTGARWDEIDRDTKTWTIPAERIKAGREHRMPLSARCLELLDAAAKIGDDSPYLFPGRSPKAPASNMIFLMLLRRMERTDITVHGFRSTFRDWAAERTNMSRAVCEAALAPVVENKTEAAYFRSDLFDQRCKLMDNWARFATAKPAKVLSISG